MVGYDSWYYIQAIHFSFIKLLTQQAVHDQSNKIRVSLQLNQTMIIGDFVQSIRVLLQDTESQAT